MNQIHARLVRTALATVLATAGLSLAATAPAQAVPNPGLHTATSLYDSLAAKAATATCPAGEQVYGAGGSIRDGGGFVTLTDIIPDSTLTSVTAWGHENGAFAGDWEVSAYAVCGPASATLQLVTATSAFDAVSPKSVGATCPAGTQLYGTGYRLDGAFGNVFVSRLTPNPALTALLVRADEDGAFGGMWQLTGYAICDVVPAGAAIGLFANTSAANSFFIKSPVSPPCPAGSHAHGLGGELSPGAFGNVLMDSLAPSATLGSSSAQAQEFGAFGGNWDVTAFVICAT